MLSNKRTDVPTFLLICVPLFPIWFTVQLLFSVEYDVAKISLVEGSNFCLRIFSENVSEID